MRALRSLVYTVPCADAIVCHDDAGGFDADEGTITSNTPTVPQSLGSGGAPCAAVRTTRAAAAATAAANRGDAARGGDAMRGDMATGPPVVGSNGGGVGEGRRLC